MSMMVSFVLSFFPRDVLDEILNLIESVSEDFLTTLSRSRKVLWSTGIKRMLERLSLSDASLEYRLQSRKPAA